MKMDITQKVEDTNKQTRPLHVILPAHTHIFSATLSGTNTRSLHPQCSMRTSLAPTRWGWTTTRYLVDVSGTTTSSSSRRRATISTSTSSSSSSPSQHQDENASVEVLLRNLSVTTNVRCGTNAHGVRGLFATGEIKRGEHVLEVSLRERAIRDEPGVVNGTTWSRQLCRALVTLQREVSLPRGQTTTGEAHEDDHRRLYYESLPKMTTGSTPIGLANDAKTVEVLARCWDCSEAVRDMTTFARQIETSFAAEKAIDKELTMEEWRWAISLVHSRTFRIEDESGRRATRRALVPGADLLNHSSASEGVNCDWKANDEYFVIQTTRDVCEGEELMLSYGEQCDRHFALFYGFLPSPNPHNRVKLFMNGREALDWYQALCGVEEGDEAWHREKERVVKLVCDKYGTYKLDKETGLRRRVIQDLYLGANGVVNDSMLLLFQEMCGDEDMAIAAIRVRAGELRDRMAEASEAIERELDLLDEYNQRLVREYRARKIAILNHIA